MLNIGQGDAILIETPTQNILIDTGDTSATDILLAELNNAGVTRFEKIILTHPHSDHIGGVNAVLENFSVDEIIDNGVISSSPLYKKYRTAEVKFSTVKNGDILNFGDATFEVFNPVDETLKSVNYKSQRYNANNDSIVGKLKFKNFSMLFTGDIKESTETELCRRADISATILKSAHHGSKTSNSADFISAVKPSAILISAGKNNKYGHPHKSALEHMRYFVQNIFCTAFNGTIKITTDGYSFLILPKFSSHWIEKYTGEKIIFSRL